MALDIPILCEDIYLLILCFFFPPFEPVWVLCLHLALLRIAVNVLVYVRVI